MKLKDIKLNKNNPRKISKEKLEKLKQSISDFPKMMELRPIVIDENMSVLGGNMRCRALNDLGYKDIPDGWIKKADNLTPEEYQRFIFEDNVGFGEWDWDALSNEYDLSELEGWGLDIPDDLFQDEKSKGLIDDDDVPDPPQVITALGDLWFLDSHRLLCGDSVETTDVARLIGPGDKPTMLFTDPPYIINFKGSPDANKKKAANSKHDEIINDNLDTAETGVFLSKLSIIIKEYVNGAYYICFYRLAIEKIINALKLNGLDYKSVIIWKKNHFNLSGADYKSIYEPVIYGCNREHTFYGAKGDYDFMTAKQEKDKTPSISIANAAIYLMAGGKYYKFEKIKRKPKHFLQINEGQAAAFNIFSGENDIWEIARTEKNDRHPTMKPIALCEKAILNSSKENEVVLDLFLGSGSTLIACEKTGRVCYGMEIDPHYCDVSLQRWADYTGKSPVRESDGAKFNELIKE